MRDGALRFARDIAENLPIAEPLVEVGARAAEGHEDIADLRPMFGADEHIGCDIQEGPGVDRIEDVHELSFADESVGTVICLETLEHVADPIRAMQEMHRVLRPGGVLAISSIMFFPIHEHPWDFWRFTPEGFERLLGAVRELARPRPRLPLPARGCVRVGMKGPEPKLTDELLPRTKALADHWADATTVDFGPIRCATRQLWGYSLTTRSSPPAGVSHARWAVPSLPTPERRRRRVAAHECVLNQRRRGTTACSRPRRAGLRG
ncbi:MAG: class I SAM-dependent methyltransferase [Acidimicrobiia bacterium]